MSKIGVENALVTFKSNSKRKIEESSVDEKTKKLLAELTAEFAKFVDEVIRQAY